MFESVRSRILVGALVLMGLVLGGCSMPQIPGAEINAAGSSSSDGVIVRHAWGTGSYPLNPERVVAVGIGVDNLLALGITPDAVVVRPDDADAVWKLDQLEGVERIETADPTSVPLEQIAAVEPDIIVGDSYRISEEIYHQMSDIAPVLGGIGTEGELLGWKPQLEALGQIYDREDVAAQVIADDEAAFAEVREALPELAGKTALVTQHRDGQFFAISDEDNPSNEFFEELGMTVPPQFSDGSVEEVFGRAAISPENLSQLTADFMVLYAADGMDAVRAVSGYEQLPQVESGCAIEGNNPVSAALNVPSPLNRTWVLNDIRPQLEKVARL